MISIIAAAALAAGTAAYAPTAGEPTLEEVRAATERFRDVKVAMAEGYVDASGMCETAGHMGMDKALGGMGIHFARMDLLGIKGPPNPRVDGDGTHTDFRKPSILIYEPRADGTLELVAVENLVFRKAWEAAGHKAPPTFHGRTWDAMQDDPATPADEAHMFEPHYDQHVWLYRENPKGTYTPFNPTVTCEHHKPAAGAKTAQHGSGGAHGGGHGGGAH
jgi:hypothetical protein